MNLETANPINHSTRVHSRFYTGRRILQILAVTLCFALNIGCDSKLGQGVSCPEVRLQHRGSIMDKSLVVIITNAGAKPLFDVAVSTQRWDKHYLISSNLKPGETVEAGWLELPSGLQTGDTVEVYAESYTTPYRANIR